MIGRFRKKTRLATAAFVALAIALELCAGSVKGQSFELDANVRNESVAELAPSD